MFYLCGETWLKTISLYFKHLMKFFFPIVLPFLMSLSCPPTHNTPHSTQDLQMQFCRGFSVLSSDSHPRRNKTWSGPFHFYTTDLSDLNKSLMCVSISGVTKSTVRTSHCSIQTSSWENENERRVTAICNDKRQIKYPAAWFFLKISMLHATQALSTASVVFRQNHFDVPHFCKNKPNMYNNTLTQEV